MSYSVNVADDDQRTMSVDDIVRAYKAGEINGETYVWADGMEDWLPIANVPAIMKAVNDSASTGLPAAGGGVRAARREPSRGAIDLFGGGDDPPAPESGRGGGGDEPHFTGQRNEQSVLFSLNSLGGSPAPKASGSGSTGSLGGLGSSSSAAKPKTNEDSGLIDLGALARAAEAQQTSSSQAAIQMAPPLQLNSILGPSVLEAPVAPASVVPPPATKNNTPIYVVAALLMFAILGVGAMFAFKSDPKPDVPVPAATTTTTATTTPSDTATATPTATSSASDPTATPAASATGAKTAAPAGTGGKTPPSGGKGGAAATPTTPPATATAAPTTPPKPTGGPCGCAPGDLSCAIACKAKK